MLQKKSVLYGWRKSQHMNNLIGLISFLLFCTFGLIAQEPDSITETYASIKNKGIPATWSSLKAIQHDWIKIEKDEKGYLIYDPCDGGTPTIHLENGQITINWQLEGESYSYEKFTRIKGNNAFRLTAYRESGTFDVYCKIYDAKNGIVCWEFEGQKWYMTTLENAKAFRTVHNNCPYEKKRELEFEPFE